MELWFKCGRNANKHDVTREQRSSKNFLATPQIRKILEVATPILTILAKLEQSRKLSDSKKQKNGDKNMDQPIERISGCVKSPVVCAIPFKT